MQAKDVHASLTKALTSAWRDQGFSRLPGTPSAWYAEGGNGFDIFRIYLDRKFGYMKPLGGRMSLRGWTSETLFRDCEPFTQQFSLGDLLPAELVGRAQSHHDLVTRKIIDGDWQTVLQAADPAGRALLLAWREEMQADDSWREKMRYVDAEDVTGWIDLLREAVPHLVVVLRSRGDAAAG